MYYAKCTSTVGPLEVTRTVGTELVETMTNKERIEAQTGLTDMDVGGWLPESSSVRGDCKWDVGWVVDDISYTGEPRPIMHTIEG